MAEIDIYYEGKLSTRCVHRETGSEIYTDAPKDNNGEGKRFSPTDLVAAAIGSCVLTVMGIYAVKNNLDFSGAKASVKKEMQQAPSRRIGKLTLIFSCPQTFAPDIQERFEKIAKTCPVHASMHPEVIQEFIFNWGQP